MIKKSDALREYRNKLALVLGSEFKIVSPSDYKWVYFLEDPTVIIKKDKSPYVDKRNIIDLKIEIHSGNFLIANCVPDFIAGKDFKPENYKQKFFIRDPLTQGTSENWWNGEVTPSLLGKRVASDFVVVEISEGLYNKYKASKIPEIGFVEKTYEDEAPEGALSDFQKIMGVL